MTATYEQDLQVSEGPRSEENENLSDVAFDVLDFLADNVEAHSLGQGSALTNSHDIADSETERWGAVGGDGSVALLKSVVLLDVVEVVTTNDDGVLHLGRNDDTSEQKLATSLVSVN
jgi:hypothetical protein